MALTCLGKVEIVRVLDSASTLMVMLKGFSNGLGKQCEIKKAVRNDLKVKIT